MEAENSISEKLIQLPQKRFYRQRAHSNPLAHHTFDYPPCPTEDYWDSVFPDRRNRQVRILDIGCGYGGLLIQVDIFQMIVGKKILAGKAFPERSSLRTRNSRQGTVDSVFRDFLIFPGF